NGNGTFQSQQGFAATSPRNVVADDMNGDGKRDLAVSSLASNNVTLLLGNGNGTFQGQQSVTVGFPSDAIRLVDMNHDGKLDLAVANFAGTNVAVLVGNGNGTFQAPATFAVGANSSTKFMAAGDLNGDGR